MFVDVQILTLKFPPYPQWSESRLGPSTFFACLPATKKQIKLRYSVSLCTLVIAFLWTNIPFRSCSLADERRCKSQCLRKLILLRC